MTKAFISHVQQFLVELEYCQSIESLHHKQSYFCGLMDASAYVGIADCSEYVDKFFMIRDRVEDKLKGDEK